MTPQEIADRLVAIRSVIVDRFEAQPFVSPSVWINTGGKVEVNLYRDHNLGDYNLKSLRGDTFEEVLDAADAFVAALPPINESRRREWMKDLGRHIDKGREIGIETEFLNPLAETMQRLSKNAIAAE